MNLKSLIAADIDNVFFNPDEFGEYHDIGGQKILCIVDEDIGEARSSRVAEQYDGIYSIKKLVHVRKCDLPKRPKYDDRIRFDGKPYLVIECTENAGVYEILMGLNDI